MWQQEVRDLAQRSASAAKDIKGLIARSAEAVRHGVAISIAARDQAQGIGEINGSIGMLDKVTPQSAATVEEASAAAASLADGARDLYGLVSRFKTSLGKGATATHSMGGAA